MVVQIPPHLFNNIQNINCFEKQSILNEFFLTKDPKVFQCHVDIVTTHWRQMVSTGHWNYSLCIMEEIGELLGSLPLAHYRKPHITLTEGMNAIMELVDLKHFVLSRITQHHIPKCDHITIFRAYVDPDIAQAYCNDLRGRNVSRWDAPGIKWQLSRCAQILIHDRSNSDELAEEFIMLCLLVERVLETHLDVDLEKGSNIWNVVSFIYELKYALNVFRQMNGANTGNYTKTFKNGRQDNDLLMQIVADVFDLSPERFLLDVRLGSAQKQKELAAKVFHIFQTEYTEMLQNERN